MILIGSRAIKHWFPDFPREPRDTDYIVDKVPEVRESKTEYLLNPVFIDTFGSNSGIILNPDELYTLKISHLFWNIKWEKHMFDVQFLRKKGCTLQRALFQRLYKFFNEFHGKNKRSDLTLSADKFFDNALKKYDHDFLHTLINPSPTYLKVLKDGSDVEPDEDKFNLLSHQEKIDLVREEVYVMAYERLGGRHFREAYAWMLKKFIIGHAPMYEALFIIDNYIELHKPSINYKQKLDYELSRNLS